MPTDTDTAAQSLAEFCERHHIQRLALFGSVLRGTAQPESDVDLLSSSSPEWNLV